MPSYRPLVLINGQIQQLPLGATLDAKIQEVDAVELQAKQAMSAGMAVYVSAAYQCQLADAADDAKATVLGLVLGAVASDAYVTILTDGVLEVTDWTDAAGSAALVPGSFYYLGAIPGTLTTTPPASGNLVHIGQALTPTKLEISLERPVKLA
ncbi:hypothetical protein [Oleisolibacter albus]|uniref:hypothetical protein n=1 Tax=Oleisolibacter albus TaxID=2171757 RepID=UPI000DF2B37B|nr:hypothetical protein [Oleisolibacter albus]